MSEIQNIFIEEHKIHTYHVDFEQKITIPSIFLFMQEIAWHHANKYGFGYQHLRDKGMFWVLSKLHLIVHRYPRWNDVLHLETWGKEPEPLTAFRDFEGYDQNKHFLFSATSAWHVLSAANNRLQRTDEFKKNFPVPEGKHAIEAKPKKLAAPENVEKTEALPILPSDIDMNMHVNNTRYVQWAIDAFGFDFVQQNIMCEIEINFLWQAVAGDQYIVTTSQQGDNEYIQSILRSSDNKELARMKTKWEKRFSNGGEFR